MCSLNLSGSRAEVAARIARAFERCDGVAAVSLYGSSAYGVPDARSDLDLKVYWDTEELDRVDEVVLPGTPRPRGARNQDGRVFREYVIDGLHVDVWHVRLASAEQAIRTVVRELDLDDRKHIEISMLLDEQVLYGQTRMATLRDRALPYPDRLADRMVRSHLAIYPHRALARLASLDETEVAVAQVLCSTVEGITGMLLGLNRLYGSVLNVKLMNRWIDRMSRTPDDVRRRLEALFVPPLGGAVDDLRALVHETLDSIEADMPHLDIAQARQFFDLDIGAVQAPAATEEPGHGRAAAVGALVAALSGHPSVAAVYVEPADRSMAAQPSTLRVAGLPTPPERVYGATPRVTAAWVAAPGDGTLDAVITQAGWRANVRLADPGGASWLEYVECAGIRLEVAHHTTGAMEEALERVVGQANPSPSSQAMLAALIRGVSVIGDDLLESWRERAAQYPDELVEAMLAQHLLFYSHRTLVERIRPRGHELYYHRIVTMMAENVIGLLLGLNRVYGSPADARYLSEWSRRLTLAPADWAERIRSPFRTGAPDDLSVMIGLVRDVLTLVERHHPSARFRDAMEMFERAAD